MMTVYHGTNNSKLTLDKLDYKHSNSCAWGPGTYFTDDLATAKEYGSNIISLEVDESRLVDGMTYRFRDISRLRNEGYIGALISLCGLVKNVVIWNINDITHPDKSNKEYVKWLKQWNKDNYWRGDF